MTQYTTVCAHLHGIGIGVVGVVGGVGDGGAHETNTYESVAHERNDEFNSFKSRTPNAKIGILP